MKLSRLSAILPPVKRTALVLALLVLCLGCGRRYRVSDARSGRVYYTRDVDRRDSGTVEFTDEKTNARIALESSVVERIPKDEFERITAKE
jgi:hypothetical protein